MFASEITATLLNRRHYNFRGDRKHRTGPGPDGEGSPFCCCACHVSFLTGERERVENPVGICREGGAGPLNYARPHPRASS
jgi:hypothetical protein